MGVSDCTYFGNYNNEGPQILKLYEGESICIFNQNNQPLYVLGDGLTFSDEIGNKKENAFASTTLQTKITATKTTDVMYFAVTNSQSDIGTTITHALKSEKHCLKNSRTLYRNCFTKAAQHRTNRHISM